MQLSHSAEPECKPKLPVTTWAEAECRPKLHFGRHSAPKPKPNFGRSLAGTDLVASTVSFILPALCNSVSLIFIAIHTHSASSVSRSSLSPSITRLLFPPAQNSSVPQIIPTTAQLSTNGLTLRTIFSNVSRSLFSIVYFSLFLVSAF